LPVDVRGNYRRSREDREIAGTGVHLRVVAVELTVLAVQGPESGVALEDSVRPGKRARTRALGIRTSDQCRAAVGDYVRPGDRAHQRSAQHGDDQRNFGRVSRMSDGNARSEFGPRVLRVGPGPHRQQRSVSVAPGETTLIRIPRGASAFAMP
jgi:hypothetical protein